MAVRRALLLGGGGVLNPCARALVNGGWWVVMPGRQYYPLRVPEQSGAPAAETPAAETPAAEPSAAGAADETAPTIRAEPSGRALWVGAVWSEPASLAGRAAKALRGRAELVVAWLPCDRREPVLRAVADLLSPAAAVVEVHSTTLPGAGLPEPALPERSTQQVVLGHVRAHGRNLRWPREAAVSDAVWQAVRHALDGGAPQVHQIGEPGALPRS